jgi:3-phytase
MIALGLIAGAAVMAVGFPADAEPQLVSELTFSPDDPSFDPYGSGTSILGDVAVAPEGWLDFFGRSVVQTPDRPSLNPGTADFSFGTRLALTRGVGDWNVMQKGFFKDLQWKLSIHARNRAAQLSCRVSGSSGVVHVFTDGAVITDSEWHQAVCARVGDEIQVRLDGAVVARGSGPIGSVTSTRPYLVGSKGIGNLADPDQYLGLIDDTFVVVDDQDVTGEPVPSGDAVTATVETEPVLHSGDAADDPAIWEHPTDPSQSLVIGNDKGGALDVYDMQGRLLQRIEEGFFGNVDVRTGVTTGTTTQDVAAVYRSGLRLYAIDPETRRLTNVTDSSTGSLPVPTGGEGLCLYQNPGSGGTYAFVISRAGTIAQYELADADSDGLVDATRVRQWSLGSEAEGCVADDELGRLYVAEEDVAIWRYGADPADGTTDADRLAVDRVASAGGRLAPDIEGLTLTDGGAGKGYLIASSQAASNTSNFFALYDRSGENAFVRRFQVVSGDETDGCGRTDGIAAWAGDLGSGFPRGAFVCQDNLNTAPGSSGNQNFKIVPLERIVAPEPTGNRPPSAVLEVDCTALSCTFDASRSSDPDGDALDYSWELGDGAVASSARLTHEFAEAGMYEVTLRVTDVQGMSDVRQQTVAVAPLPDPAIEFRAAAGLGVNASTVSPRVPAAVSAGDALLLAVTANRANATLQPPAGWRSLGRQVDETMQTQVWMKVAQAGDAGATVPVTSSRSAKLVAQIAAYGGTHPTDPVAAVLSASETSTSAVHTTPTATTDRTSWTVSLWSNKSSSTTSWLAPAGVKARQYQGTSGSGRVTALLADSGAPIGATSAGGLGATASQSGSMATMWTIVLTPA